MFFYRGLFLAVTISLANIIFADVIVQPGSKKLDNDPHYSPDQPQYYIPLLPEQYHANQLSNQELDYLSGIQTLYQPDESYQGSARSHLNRYPYHLPHQHYPYLPRPHHVHYAKIGGHGYVRPSVFVGYPQPPLIVHSRCKRSDLTSTEFNKSETVARSNDVTLN